MWLRPHLFFCTKGTKGTKGTERPKGEETEETKGTKRTEEKALSTVVRDLALVPWSLGLFGLKVSQSLSGLCDLAWSQGLQLSASLACLFVAKVDYYGKIFRCLKNFA